MSSQQLQPQNQQIQRVQSAPMQVMSGKKVSISTMTFEEAEKLCIFLAQSRIIPKALQGNPADVYIVLGMGEELGIPAMTALQNVGVVGGKPMLYGPAVLGLVMNHPDYITSEGEYSEAEQGAWFTVVRRNHKPITARFSMEDAKRHDLLNKDNWRKDPKLMCLYRAKGRALKAAFGDILSGIAAINKYSDIDDAEDVSEMMIAISGPPTVEHVLQLIQDATTRAELESARDIGKQLPEQDRQSPALRDAFMKKAATLVTIDGAEQRLPAEQAA